MSYFMLHEDGGSKILMTEKIRDRWIKLLVPLMVIIVAGCSSSRQITLYINCTNNEVELFSNGEYLGIGGPIPIIVRNNQQSIEIEGRKRTNGQTLFVKNYYAPFKNNSLIEIQYDEPLFYSN